MTPLKQDLFSPPQAGHFVFTQSLHGSCIVRFEPPEGAGSVQSFLSRLAAIEGLRDQKSGFPAWDSLPESDALAAVRNERNWQQKVSWEGGDATMPDAPELKQRPSMPREFDLIP